MGKQNDKGTNRAPRSSETEFSIVRFKGETKRSSNTYNGFKLVSGEDIANVVRFVVTLPAHVCINDVVVTPTAQANATNIYRK